MTSPADYSAFGNWRYGLAAAAIFSLVWGCLFFAAFMIAFGNPTPASRSILTALGNLLTYINPLWGIFAAYLAGAFLFQREDPTRIPYDDKGSEKR